MSFWKKKNEEAESSSKPSSTTNLASKDITRGPSAATPAKDPAKEEVAARLSQSGVSVQVNKPASQSSTQKTVQSVIEELERRFGKVRSALSPGTNIQGKLSFDVAVRIDGELGGEIFSSQPIIVGPAGRVSASIEASSVIILGKVEGDVSAKERVEVLKGGRLKGDIKCPVFVLEEEGQFDGTMTMKNSLS